MLQACINGVRLPGQHPALPVSPDELAAAAAAAVAAGAESVHLHPKLDDGTDSLDPEVVAAAIEAVRTAVPGIPIGTTTGAWASASAPARAAQVAAWPVMPDFASVNWHEDGAAELAALLIGRGVGVEAGVWTERSARDFVATSLARQCLRALGEPMEPDPAAAIATGHAIAAAVNGLSVPLLLHGMDGAAWPVLTAAARHGFDVRIGLEDVLALPDGSAARDNAELVAAARDIVAGE